MAVTILVTGFGPFPGAPFNPTAALVKRLTRLRRTALADITVVPHVFATGYAAVDQDLPQLLARHKPDALLMFGLATRAKTMRIELRARNTLALLADASGSAPVGHAIAAGAPPALAMRAPARRLLGAIRAADVAAVLSRDAGRYLCNYICWRAAEAVSAKTGPRLAAFIHVPAIRHGNGRVKRHSLDDLARAGGRALVALAAAARR